MGLRITLFLKLTLALTAASPFVSSTARAQASEPTSDVAGDSPPVVAPEPSPPQPPARPEPSSADRATARTLAQEGYNALKGKDYATAADRFSRALALVHAPTLLRDLARAQLGLGKLVDAHESYSQIIREGVAPDAPASWIQAVADAKAEIASIPPRLPWVTVTVAGPSSPEVTIDGQPIAAASIGVKRPIDPGRHEIRALGAGFYTAKKFVTLQEGQSINVAFELEEAPPDAPPKVAEERSGKVIVTFAEPAWRKPVMIGAYAVGGAGLALGAVTGILALRKHGQLSTDCTRDICGPPQKPALDNFHTLAQLSTIGFVVAGVGAATGTVLLFMRPQPQEEDEATAGNVEPSWSPYVGLASVGVGGTF